MIIGIRILTLISHLRVVIDWAATKIDVIRFSSNMNSQISTTYTKRLIAITIYDTKIT